MSVEAQRRTTGFIANFKAGELLATYDPMKHGTSASIKDKKTNKTIKHKWIPNGSFVLFLHYTGVVYCEILWEESVWEVHTSYLKRRTIL